jgi:hypothetical protein
VYEDAVGHRSSRGVVTLRPVPFPSLGGPRGKPGLRTRSVEGGSRGRGSAGTKSDAEGQLRDQIRLTWIPRHRVSPPSSPNALRSSRGPRIRCARLAGHRCQLSKIRGIGNAQCGTRNTQIWASDGFRGAHEVQAETRGYHSVVEKRSTEARGSGQTGTESPRQARMHKRLGARLPLGGLLGAIAGAIIGALVGLLFFDRSAAILASILASAVFGLGVGMLVAGYSSLESPDPGAEPSDTAQPVVDRPEAVREERSDRPVSN